LAVKNNCCTIYTTIFFLFKQALTDIKTANNSLTKTLVLCDVSSSMTGKPMEVAIV